MNFWIQKAYSLHTDDIIFLWKVSGSNAAKTIYKKHPDFGIELKLITTCRTLIYGLSKLAFSKQPYMSIGFLEVVWEHESVIFRMGDLTIIRRNPTTDL